MNKKIELNTNKYNKKVTYSLTLILLLAMTLMITFTQTSLAQVGVNMPEKTVGFASVSPTLIGVDQIATVNLWVYPLPTTYDYHPYFQGFFDITVTFTKPDGTKDTFMPVDGTGGYEAGQMTSLGSMYFYYTPKMAGNWSVSWTMPAQNITDSTGTVQYLGCTSNTAYFEVQTEPVLAGLLNGYPWSELPNSNAYWRYPINANNREWSQISGDWTGVTNTMATVNSATQLRWQPYGSGPNTAHITWSQPIKVGGMIGGDYGSLSYTAGLNTVVVMDGKVFTNIPNTTPIGQVFGQFRCFDEATGQLLYTANGSVSNGIHLPGSTYQQSNLDPSVLLASSYGSYQYPYVFGTATVNGVVYWNYYDPLTGTLVRQIANASSARLIDGTVLAFGAANGYVYRWNMTSVVNNNWQTGMTWKVPMPKPLSYLAPSIFAVSSDLSVLVISNRNQYWAYDATTGASLWNLTLTYQVNTNEEIPLAQVDDFIVLDPTACAWKCYSIKTGTLLWTTPSVASSPWATTWTVYNSETNDLNNLYLACPDGSMRAYSLTDGQLLWTSTAIPSTEYANNAVPLVMGGLVMVDGKLYVYAGYSIGYQINPVPRFATLICINATNGDTIYTLNGGVAPSAAANGYLIGSSVYDGNMYCVGKGQTSTTVTIQNNVITNHATTLITGNILDQSPAQAGTPAVADASMSEWMDYLHMQNATLLNNPPNPEGIPVTLTATDPNGNTITIGTTTTDSEGNYAINFVPESTGMYTIQATFDGTNAYYSSHSDTHLSVIAETTSTTSPISYEPVNDNMMTITVGMGIAIIITIVIATILLLRKRA
ncbi:MAG: PQQ-binding-like beta-propeller repeat protein [Candidatus Bathyarchaeia archaeon]